VTFSKALLWINTALFIAFGLGFIFAPAFFANLITGATPGTPSAMIDMRATYGGFGLGIALFYGWCAQNSQVRLGLLASLLVMAAIAGGRIVGFVLDGSPNLFMWLLLAAETLFVALIFLTLRGNNE
jgi:hypothetical protein